jgi:hypothetical protein
LGGDPQDVGSVDEGRDAESRPPVRPWTLASGSLTRSRKERLKHLEDVGS